uniref:Tubulin--tyrosine ligase-like protein 9 n=2 Tax=Coccolithus braarudii TaxID=221442 RepID=A0A7S0PTM5_9EUKA|mmetsp:Transcript_10225/g.22181  ORF Transcript_10225/g.22181 Transcript_10225/m.22181 type:complete len:419 (+) Transcript_10225:95-1351(+)
MRRSSQGPGGGGGTIRFRTTFHNTIYDVFRARNWKETDSETDWDVAWIDTGWIRENFDTMHLEEHQRINHFRNHYELTRKDCMNKNLKRMQRALQREDRHDEAGKYDFFPNTYVLPVDYGLFVEEFKHHQAGSIWIMKPIGKAQGKGIFLFSKLSQITEWKKDHKWKPDSPQAETYVVQRYLENPMLIGGKKFDLRIYALVTSFMPLVVYLYRSGFARFSSFRYNTNQKNLGDTYVHLTNVAVQKTGPGYDAGAGCKWPLRNLKLYLIGKFGVQATDKLFYEIQELVISSLLSVQKVMIHDKHCFEMYGYDILIDDALKPWLIEVNASPSLTADTPQDYELKFGLLDDLYTVIDVENKLGGVMEECVGGYDLIYNNGPMKRDKQTCYTTRLGCFDDRVRQLKRLHKAHAKRSSASSDK